MLMGLRQTLASQQRRGLTPVGQIVELEKKEGTSRLTKNSHFNQHETNRMEEVVIMRGTGEEDWCNSEDLFDFLVVFWIYFCFKKRAPLISYLLGMPAHTTNIALEATASFL